VIPTSAGTVIPPSAAALHQGSAIPRVRIEESADSVARRLGVKPIYRHHNDADSEGTLWA
jgi:hypothetical protein